ncbi:hypothetical protein HID58_004725 [Brassica napus]|uniref:cyanoalanine nitrilase n=1 Tax=Brassica napus TaxID=3708 RepID=A0ABQ8E6I8_BRANA|nr:hypothetical protein HID58_004725 [Brassica napus]
MSTHQQDMSLVTSTPPINNGNQIFPDIEMSGDSSSIVRATVVQACTIFYDTPATLDKAERLLAEAADNGSQLVVFPEAFIGGYPRGSSFELAIGARTAKGRDDFRKYLASAIDVPGYTLYCSVLFFDSHGQFLGKHRKLMPTALERCIWGFGDGSTIPVFDTPIGKIGIEIYCAPTADARETWLASMTHIALEGGCFVLSANQFCRRKDYPPPPEYTFSGSEESLTPDSVVCAGGSSIISPLGIVLAGPNYEGEGLISADLDLGDIARAKFDFDVVGHYSRPEVFSLNIKEHPRKAVSFTSKVTKDETVKN